LRTSTPQHTSTLYQPHGWQAREKARRAGGSPQHCGGVCVPCTTAHSPNMPCLTMSAGLIDSISRRPKTSSGTDFHRFGAPCGITVFVGGAPRAPLGDWCPRRVPAGQPPQRRARPVTQPFTSVGVGRRAAVVTPFRRDSACKGAL